MGRCILRYVPRLDELRKLFFFLTRRKVFSLHMLVDVTAIECSSLNVVDGKDNKSNFGLRGTLGNATV